MHRIEYAAAAPDRSDQPSPAARTSHAAGAPFRSPGDVQRNANRQNMLQLIRLRWIAVTGQLGTIAVAMQVFNIPLPLAHMLQILVCLAAFNVASMLRWREDRPVTNRALFCALLVDVASLTGQLFFSGGVSNPFALLYLLQVILGAVLLEARSTWSIVVVTSACLTGLSLVSTPLPLPAASNGALSNLYVAGLLICFALNASLLTFFVTRIHRNLRAGDALLADLRQHAAEEDHIVRMGLLASGAAHELGTPLATLSVILGDWRRMPEFAGHPHLLEDLDEMQSQLNRCKSIVSGVLLSAGEARGESSVKTTLRTFFDDIAAEWRETRPAEQFVYASRITSDVPVAFDSALKQSIDNLLDNAFEASPHWLQLEAACDGSVLTVTVTDAGPGFSADMLAHLGRPYQSTKGRPGSGLGLFFATNVVRKLNGTLAARNRSTAPDADGVDGSDRRKSAGAMVTLTLPLAAISLEPGKGHTP